MKTRHAVLGALMLGALGVVAGYLAATRSPHLLTQIATLIRPATDPLPAAQAQDDPVLFYRDPMDEPIVSAGARQDSMGMDFLPVRRSAVAPLLARLPSRAAPPPAGEAPLFYRDPMGGTAVSATPRQDSMGMDFLPVHSADIAPILPPLRQAAATAPAAGGADRRILYYRNPMGLPDVSPVPKKDSMGMDYIPVYADEATNDGTLAISPARIQTLGVRTEAVGRRVLARTIRALGTITADERRQATVTSRFDGWIERLHVNEIGREVTRGEPLMEVYSPELLRAQADYLAGQANRQRGEPDNGRMRLLNLGLSDTQIDAIRAAGRAARTVIMPAPITGTVLAKTALEGMMFRPGDALFALADLSVVTVMADVFEQDVGALHPGQAARISIAAHPGDVFAGVVDRIYPALDPLTRTARLRVTLPNPDGRLLTGMLATVEIDAPVAGGREVVAVPTSALLDGGRRRVVLVALGEGRFRPAEVRTGARVGGSVEILDGLDGSERVVVGANFLIDAESNLRAALAAFVAPPAAGAEAGR